MGVCDLRYTGTHLTWTNKQDDYPVAKKLDRQLINSPLTSVFPHAMSSFLPPLFSDHCPCLTDLAVPLPQAGTHPFRFFNYLTKHPNFTEVVSDAWFQAGSEAITLTTLCWKLKNIKNSLKTLNRENYSNLQERVSEANRLLQIAQVLALESPSYETFAEEKALHERWTFLRLLEESYFRQKSRINWLREGDLNTTYFFRVCQARACYNAIRSFLLASGDTITDPLEMSLHAVAHFQWCLGLLTALLLPCTCLRYGSMLSVTFVVLCSNKLRC